MDVTASLDIYLFIQTKIPKRHLMVPPQASAATSLIHIESNNSHVKQMRTNESTSAYVGMRTVLGVHRGSTMISMKTYDKPLVPLLGTNWVNFCQGSKH